MTIGAVKTFDWWMDFGAIVYVYNNKAWFRTYE
jgi:hypothetical protein